MAIKTLHIPNSRLTEGESYTFTILKVVSLTPDEAYFVMRDPLGYKMMMPEKYYVRYGFEAGQQIQCRVDKVNCNGRMFLEPQHPHYIEGRTYPFEVIGAGSHETILNQNEKYLMVKDVLDYEWIVITQNEGLVKKSPDTIRCRVTRIKKGKLYLHIEGETIESPHLLPGQTHIFQVIGEYYEDTKGLSYFVIEDAFGGRHKLSKKYFSHYDLYVNATIRCRVMHLSPDGSYALEPEHPCYKIGNEYGFNVDRIEALVFSDGFRQKVLVLNDCFGEEVKVHVDDHVVPQLMQTSTITARVKNIYKSRLELELPTHN